MKKFLILFAVFVIATLGGKGLASSPEPHSPTFSPEVFYTTKTNIEAATWVKDNGGGFKYSTKETTIDPSTDQACSSTSREGVTIKAPTANNRSAWFYVKGITEFKAYACNAKNRAELIIEYGESNSDTLASVKTTVSATSATSVMATVSDLEPSKSYKFFVHANADGSQEMILYAIKLTKGTVTPPTPALISFTPADSTTDVAKGSDITFTYNVAVDTPVVWVNNVKATVTASADNKTFTVSGAVSAYNTTYYVTVAETKTTADATTTVTGKEWSFKTAAYPVPTATLDPVNGATNVSVSQYIKITYSAALKEKPEITINGTPVEVQESYSQKVYGVNQDKFKLNYGTTYTVTVSSTPTLEDPSVMTEAITDWTFTTKRQTVETSLKTTTTTTQWDLPVSTGTSVMNESLALVDVYSVNTDEKTFTLKKITEGTGSSTSTDKPSYMVFKIPANATGYLVISADGNNRPIRVLTSTTVQTLEQLQAAEKANTQPVTLGTTTSDLKTFTKEITADDANDTYVYIYNTGGQVNYHSVMWTLEPYTTAPTATVTPADGATDVAVGSDIVITYSAALNAAPTVTVKEGETSLSDVAVTTTDNKTFTVKGAVTAYNTTYTVSVASAAAAENTSVMTEAKTWSFTTETQSTEATLAVTGKTIQWELPYGRNEEHFSVVVGDKESGELSLVKVHNTDATKRHITLKKVNTKEGDGDLGHEGHMVFKIPAGVKGNLVISNDAKERNICVLTSTKALTLTDLQTITPTKELGSSTAEGTVNIVSAEITAYDADTYVYIYNKGGQVNYHSVMWTLVPCFITAVSPTESQIDVAVGSDLTVTYNDAVNAPAITIDGAPVSADKVTTTDNKTFTVSGVAAAENTTYSVEVGKTTLTTDNATEVMGKSWIFTTSAPTVKKSLNVCGVEVDVPESAAQTIYVNLPYYFTYNYQDSAQIVTNTKGVNCTVTDVAPKVKKFEFEYTLKIDGETYTMHTARQAFRTSGSLSLTTAGAARAAGDVSVGSLYLMPTQPVEKGSEPTAITIIADCQDAADVAGPNNKDEVLTNEDAFLKGTPTLTGQFVLYEGKNDKGEDVFTNITPEIAWDDTVYVYKQYGYKTSKVYGTFTHDGMNVRVALIRNLVPPTDELRICTFEDIDVEQYLPSGKDADGKANSITYRGIKIFASTSDPKTPVRVTYFDVEDHSKSLTVGSYGPYYKSLKMGGKADLDGKDPVKDSETAEPVARYVSIETLTDQVVMALALNGSNTHKSKFRIKGPKAVSRDRLLPEGGTGWWGHRAKAGGTAKMYGFDSGTNDDAGGGNVAYCFISAGPGKQYQREEELNVQFNPSMATVKVGTDVRALTTSNEQVKLVVKIPKVNLQGEVATGSITSFRTSHLSFRKICSIDKLNKVDYPNITDKSMEESSNPALTFATSYGSEDKLPYENMFAANLISQVTETITEGGVEKWQVTLVVETQKKLEGSAYYELWGNHGMFLVADEDVPGTPGDRLLSFAMPLYRIFTADEKDFNYRDFEYAAGDGETTQNPDRIAPSNVHLDSPTASAAVVRLDTTVVDDVTGTTDNGSYVLGAGDAENTEFGVILDTPKEKVYDYTLNYPGDQKVLDGGYKYITFSVFIPANVTKAASESPTVSIVADNEAETPIKLVNPDVAYVYDGHRNALAPVEPMDAQTITPGEWTEVKAASYVASNEFPEFPAADRIKIKVSGAKKAYLDNLVFHTENQLPTSVAELSEENEAYFDGRCVVAPSDCAVEVYGTTGMLVLTGKGRTDLSRLNSGIYIVRCGNKVLKIAK